MLIEKIWIVCKTHFDIGFTHLAEEIIPSYSTELIPRLLNTCDIMRQANPSMPYVWTMPSWPLKTILESPFTNESLYLKIIELIKSGELTYHMLPFTTHTDFVGIEELIRGLKIGKVLGETFEKNIISAKMTDVPGHTRYLPSILAKAGIKFLHLGCNPGCMPPAVPQLFYWQGPDGGKVLTFYNKGGYGSGLCPPPNWNFPVWLALMQTNDNVGPHSSTDMAAIIEEARAKYPQAQIQIGTLDDFYKDLVKYPLDGLPIITEDLADTWIHGVGSYPKEVSYLRESRKWITETEKLSVLYLNNIEQIQSDIDYFYEQSLLFGEHTWGLDVKTTMGYNRHYKKSDFLSHLNDPHYIKMEKSWTEQSERAIKSGTLIRQMNKVQMDQLASQIKNDEPCFVVWSGLGYTRNGWVDITNYDSIRNHRQLKDGNTELPIRKRDQKTEVYVPNLPKLGYKTLTLGDIEDKSVSLSKTIFFHPQNGILENHRFKLKLASNNIGLISLIDKKTQKEWIDNSSGLLLGQYRYEIIGLEEITEFIRSYSYRFYDWLVNDLGRMSYPDQPHAIYDPVESKVEFIQGNGYGTLVLTCQNPIHSYEDFGNSPSIQVQITLYEETDFIDLKLSIPNKVASPMVESGSLIFPFKLDNAEIKINKMGHLIDIQTDIIKDANHGLYCCDQFVQISDEKNSLAVISKDAPLFSIGENSIYHYESSPKPKKPILFNNLFNNSWGTNFPQWMSGSYEYHYRLAWDVDTETAQKIAYDFTTPISVGFSANCSGNMPMLADFIEYADGFSILAVKTSEDKSGISLRLIDLTGKSRKGILKFNQYIHSIYLTGCLEQDKELLAQNCYSIYLHTNPYEIHTLVLSF